MTPRQAASRVRAMARGATTGLAHGHATDAQALTMAAAALDAQATTQQAAIDALCRQRRDLAAAILASIIGLAAGAVLALLVVGALP
jgi:hypothetical protein